MKLKETLTFLLERRRISRTFATATRAAQSTRWTQLTIAPASSRSALSRLVRRVNARTLRSGMDFQFDDQISRLINSKSVVLFFYFQVYLPRSVITVNS
jgi:hypothetical protein